ncbi:MAG: hypothetical protein ACRDMV_07040 [Streptosporangiales bacterium]
MLLTPKWLGLHALTVFLVLAFIGLGYWQVLRGEAGNARSWGYAFQWPAFAIFVIFMWIRMMREELHPKKDERPVAAARLGSDPLPDAVAATSAPVEDEDDDPELVAELEEYNRYLATLNAHAERADRRQRAVTVRR